MNAETVIAMFRAGIPLTDFNGRRIVEAVTYSCGPERIDGLGFTDDDIAIRCEGESEGGLTPYELWRVIRADTAVGLLKK
jgi:hypothetical protein